MERQGDVRMGKYEEILKTLNQLEMRDEGNCLASLAERKRRELEFHDRDRDRERMTLIDKETFKREYGNIKFYGGARKSVLYVDEWLKKMFLERFFSIMRAGMAGKPSRRLQWAQKLR